MNFVRARRTAGLSLMLSSLVVGLLMAPAAIAAEPEVPEGAKDVEPTRQAFWNGDRSKYADNAATSQFPPQAVCLVQPSACFFPEGEEDPSGELGLGGQLNEGTQTAGQQEQELLATIGETEDGQDPADPVQEGDLPVSIAFGEPNYRSAIQFELPPLPDGELVSSFAMVLTEGDPTYSNESPAFRQAVLAALTCAQENEEPQGRCASSEFEKIPDQDLSDGSPLLVEACPIVGEWSEGQSQDEDTLPEVNCLYTAAGARVPVEGGAVWVFDLALTAQAWYDGTIQPNGLLLSPGAAANLAYGDSEQTYSKQVTFTPPVQIAMTTEPEPAPPPAPPAPFTGSTFGGSGDVFATPPSSGSGGFVSPPSTSSQPVTSEEPPAVSEPTGTDGATTQTEEPATLAAGTPLGEPETPWWLWFLVPTFFAGAWLLSRSLQEQAVMASSDRSGAMTRLLERREATTTANLITG